MSGVLTPAYERIVVAESKSRTATETFGPFPYNRKHKGIYLLLSVSGITDTPSIEMKIQGRWNTTDSWADLLVDAAVATATTSPLWLFPGAATTANVSANGYLPPEWQVVVTAGDADAAVYSIVGFLLP